MIDIVTARLSITSFAWVTKIAAGYNQKTNFFKHLQILKLKYDFVNQKMKIYLIDLWKINFKPARVLDC